MSHPGHVQILLATYNGSHHLKDQLDSLLAQIYTDWSLLVHDDGSTDTTLEILHDYRDRYPEKIHIIDEPVRFGNASSNFAFLLERSDADYVMFCDQDDVWLPEKIAKTHAAMKKLEERYPGAPLLVHTDLTVVDQDLNTLDPSFWHYQNLDPSLKTFNRLLMQNNITGCTVMVNRTLAGLAAPVPEEAIMHDWWLGIVAAAFGHIDYIHEPTMLYRQHGSNSVGAQKTDLSLILDKLRNPYIIRHNIRQAEAFLARYETKLSVEYTEILKDFISLEKGSPVKKRLLLTKRGFYKHGLLRNIGLFVML